QVRARFRALSALSSACFLAGSTLSDDFCPISAQRLGLMCRWGGFVKKDMCSFGGFSPTPFHGYLYLGLGGSIASVVISGKVMPAARRASLVAFLKSYSALPESRLNIYSISALVLSTSFASSFITVTRSVPLGFAILNLSAGLGTDANLIVLPSTRTYSPSSSFTKTYSSSSSFFGTTLAWSDMMAGTLRRGSTLVRIQAGADRNRDLPQRNVPLSLGMQVDGTAQLTGAGESVVEGAVGVGRGTG
ncbi:uncharacterized protein B0J16DRAFT_393264, partial [Fusarium flagelliforme]|uniref:uncharacterized protein n=1 Tax=Fusarium flagelliforme TaxID=2675880 RepID=UPI001E8D4954